MGDKKKIDFLYLSEPDMIKAGVTDYDGRSTTIVSERRLYDGRIKS